MSITDCAQEFDRYLAQVKAIQSRNQIRDQQYQQQLAVWENEYAQAKAEYETGWNAENKGPDYIEYNGELVNCRELGSFAGCCQDAGWPMIKCKKQGKYATCGCATGFCRDEYCSGSMPNERLLKNFKQEWWDNKRLDLESRKPVPPTHEAIPNLVLSCQDCSSKIDISDSKNLESNILNQKNTCIANLTDEKNPGQSNQNNEEDSSGYDLGLWSWILIAVAILILLILTGGGLFFIFKK